MNIFYLHHDPIVCAAMHCDKHVVKMILEYGQMLSTAHRVLDGMPIIQWRGEENIAQDDLFYAELTDEVFHRITSIGFHNVLDYATKHLPGR